MNETRAEIPRKVLLQEGLWVAPEWVVEDIEGDLQFLADPRPMTQFLRTQSEHPTEEQLEGVFTQLFG